MSFSPQSSPLSPETMQYLRAQGFPHGLVQALTLRIRQSCPLRVWILDNSGGMQAQDAHILQANYTYQPATRWQELVDSVLYHADLAVRLHWPTRVALLSAPSPQQQQHFAVNQIHAGGQPMVPTQEYEILQHALTHVVPQGPCADALLEQLRLLREYVEGLAPSLRTQQQHVAVIIATQGLLADSRGRASPYWRNMLIEALQSFAGLPVAFVLRLCTDDEQVLDFYNTLDARIPLPLDVLDDFYNEALEVYLRNPWLCYSIVLHRLRELGCYRVELDEIDERALTLTELHSFLQFLFGVKLPLPQQDWSHFCETLQECLIRERQHWNPILKCVTPWLNMALLHSIYGPLANGRPAPRQAYTSYHRPPPPQPTSSQPRQPPAPSRYSAETSSQAQASLPAAPPLVNSSNQSPAAPPPTTVSQLTSVLERQWSKVPPQFTHSKTLAELLATLSVHTFATVPHHAYFDKFHPFARDAFVTKDVNVLKRAVRKVRLLLHPDKLPSDLSSLQQALCRYIWDTISEAWEVFK